MFRILFFSPRIAPNTGNAIRMVAATGCELHLVEPLGFELTESRVKRAGLDYWNNLALRIHESFDKWLEFVESDGSQGRVFFIETWGEKSLHQTDFKRGDWLVFGKETTGLTREQVKALAGGGDHVLHLPMPGEVRSLNLSNAVAVSVFEVLRQVETPL